MFLYLQSLSIKEGLAIVKISRRKVHCVETSARKDIVLMGVNVSLHMVQTNLNVTLTNLCLIKLGPVMHLLGKVFAFMEIAAISYTKSSKNPLSRILC